MFTSLIVAKRVPETNMPTKLGMFAVMLFEIKEDNATGCFYLFHLLYVTLHVWRSDCRYTICSINTPVLCRDGTIMIMCLCTPLHKCGVRSYSMIVHNAALCVYAM